MMSNAWHTYGPKQFAEHFHLYYPTSWKYIISPLVLWDMSNLIVAAIQWVLAPESSQPRM